MKMRPIARVPHTGAGRNPIGVRMDVILSVLEDLKIVWSVLLEHMMV